MDMVLRVKWLKSADGLSKHIQRHGS